MKVKRTYKYRIYPKQEQKSILEKWLETCRVLYNDCLTERRDAWQSCRKSINYYDQADQLKEIKSFDNDLKEIHSQVVQDVLKRIDKAFKNFFRRVKRKEKAGYPRYRPKSRYNSFTYPQTGFEFSKDGKKLILSPKKIGSINIKQHRDIPEDAEIKTCTIERDLDRWYACFTVEIEVKEPNQGKEITNPIGVDLSINHLITLSNEDTEDNPRYLTKSERKLARKQKKLSKSRKGSNNRRKRRFEVAKTYRKIRWQRTDLLHKVSHSLDILHNYKMSIVIADPNPTYSGNKFVQIKS